MAGEGSGYGQTPTAIPTANLATVRANNEPSRQSGQANQVWLMHVEQWETGGSLGLSSRGGRDSRDKHQKEWLSLLSSDLSGFFSIGQDLASPFSSYRHDLLDGHGVAVPGREVG